MFKPSEEKSVATRELIHNIFNQRVEHPEAYTVAYAYYIKSGLFGQKSSSYVVGFSESEGKLIVIPMGADGASGEALQLSKSQIDSAKFDMQGAVRIKSAVLKEELRLTVPPYTATSLESAYILPIIQETEAKQFKAFIG